MARKSAQEKAEEIAAKLSDKPVPKKKNRGGNFPQVIDVSKVPSETLRAIVAESSRDFKKPIVKTDEECIQRLVDFFDYYANTNGVGIPTVEKMCIALGADANTVWDWQNGAKGADRAVIIKRAKQILAAIDADLVLNGHINPVAYIFRAKNYYGLKDQQDVVLQAKNIFGDGVSREEIERRLLEDTGGSDSATIEASGEVKDD